HPLRYTIGHGGRGRSWGEGEEGPGLACHQSGSNLSSPRNFKTLAGRRPGSASVPGASAEFNAPFGPPDADPPQSNYPSIFPTGGQSLKDARKPSPVPMMGSW